MSKLSFGINFSKNPQKDSSPQRKLFSDEPFSKSIRFFEELDESHPSKEVRRYTSFIFQYMKQNDVQKTGNRILLPLTTFDSL